MEESVGLRPLGAAVSCYSGSSSMVVVVVAVKLLLNAKLFSNIILEGHGGGESKINKINCLYS